MKYKVKNIRWETDGEDPKELGLPKSVVVDHTALDLDPDLDPEDWEHNDFGDEVYIGDQIADWLSDTYGWLVQGFDFAPMVPKKSKKSG